jgi:hypothetical protein
MADERACQGNFVTETEDSNNETTDEIISHRKDKRATSEWTLDKPQGQLGAWWA